MPWAGETGGPVAARVGRTANRCRSPSTMPTSSALAMQRLRGKLDYSDVGFALLPERFTLRAAAGRARGDPRARRSTSPPSAAACSTAAGSSRPARARPAPRSAPPNSIASDTSRLIHEGEPSWPRSSNLGFLAQLRSDASNHVIRYRNGKRPAERARAGLLVPAGDREHRRAADGRPRDDAVREGPQPGFPDASRSRARSTWHVVDPELLAARVDFSLGLRHRRLQERADRADRDAARAASSTRRRCNISAQAPVRALLDAGPEPLRAPARGGARRRSGAGRDRHRGRRRCG